MTAFSLPPQIDLTDPADFLLALYYARDYPRPKLFNREQWDRDAAIVDQYHADIFDLGLGYDRSALPVYDFLAAMGKAVVIDPAVAASILTPRQFLPVFTIAFEQGLISDIAYGVAVSTLLTRHGEGNGAPTFPKDSVAARLEMLDAVKAANPCGLMLANELEKWAALPAIVTIYRGGYAPNATDRREALHTSHLSLFWGVRPDLSASYARVRANQSMRAEMRGIQYNLHNAFALGLPCVGNGFQKMLSQGESFLIKADVPRDLILSYRIVGNGENDEFMVDFPNITPDMITDISGQLTGRKAAA
jgi:hypothetical protein